MKKILLSFKPFWAEKIMTGEKIYEYRKRFGNEPVMAYMYVSKPIKAIQGIVLLDSKIYLDDWESKYKDSTDIIARIQETKKNNTVAMPITKVIPTNSIQLNDIQKRFPRFFAPQMYYILDNNPDLLKYIEEKIEYLPGELDNTDMLSDTDRICEKFR